MNVKSLRRRATVVVAIGLLAGCGPVRLETPPPTEPAPDAIEVVRRSAVDDARTLQGAAENLRGVPGISAAQRTEAERIGVLTEAQAQALGGVYVSGLDSPESVPSPIEVLAVGGPEVLLSELANAAERNRASADAAEEDGSARLFASMATANALAHTRLSKAFHLSPAEWITTNVPVPGTDDDAVPPEGLTTVDYQALVLAEDAARYAYEVAAARAPAESAERELYRSRASQHRERAEGWARLAGIADTADDPRQLAYDLPPELDTAAFRLSLEEKLAQIYATLIGRAAPGSRGMLIDLLVESTIIRDEMGAEPEQFPGLVGFTPPAVEALETPEL